VAGQRAFSEQAKAALPAFLNAQEVKEKLAPEEYGKLQERLGRQEREALEHHRVRLAALEKLLTASQKERIAKIESLLAALNEQEAEYIRFRLLTLAEG
jgi:hypothetical protein